jgi:hypothetical protein
MIVLLENQRVSIYISDVAATVAIDVSSFATAHFDKMMFLLLERIAACIIDNHYLLRRGRRIGLDPLGSEVVSCWIWMFECGG